MCWSYLIIFSSTCRFFPEIFGPAFRLWQLFSMIRNMCEFWWVEIWVIIRPNKYDGIVTYPPLRKQGFGGSVYLPRFLQVEWCKTAIWQSQMTQATNQLQAWSIGNPRHLTLPSFKFKHSTLSSCVHPGNADWTFRCLSIKTRIPIPKQVSSPTVIRDLLRVFGLELIGSTFRKRIVSPSTYLAISL